MYARRKALGRSSRPIWSGRGRRRELQARGDRGDVPSRNCQNWCHTHNSISFHPPSQLNCNDRGQCWIQPACRTQRPCIYALWYIILAVKKDCYHSIDGNSYVPLNPIIAIRDHALYTTDVRPRIRYVEYQEFSGSNRILVSEMIQRFVKRSRARRKPASISALSSSLVKFVVSPPPSTRSQCFSSTTASHFTTALKEAQTVYYSYLSLIRCLAVW